MYITPSTDRKSSQRRTFFFFQAEDGIRAHCVTGVQTCALPICRVRDHLDLEHDRLPVAAARHSLPHRREAPRDAAHAERHRRHGPLAARGARELPRRRARRLAPVRRAAARHPLMRWALPALVLLLAGCGSHRGTIAFTSTRDGNAEVYAMRADGGGIRDLTRNLAQDGQPAWSPDGKTIAFVSTRDGNAGIYAMHADGSGQRRLTRSEANDTAPVWSPDGRKIAFMCTVATPRIVTEICAVGADGRGRLRLTTAAEGDNLYPQWSHDSQVILCTRSYGR